SMFVDQKEPIASPSDVSSETFHGNILGETVTRHIADRNIAGCMQLRRHNSNWRFDSVQPRSQTAEICERFHDADRAVPAHAEVADVVEEDYGGGRRRISGWKEQRTDEGIGSARLVDNRRRIEV